MSKFITPIETLEELIEEGTVDCYDEHEAKNGNDVLCRRCG